MTVNIFQLLIKRLQAYPGLSYKIEKSMLSLEAPSEDGFDISLTLTDDGFELYFSGWHETFTEEAEAKDCFLFGLSKKCRLKVHKKGDTEYKWTMQSKTLDGDWMDQSTTGLMFFPFWEKEEVIFKQNSVTD